jgi:type II secretion system protein N
MRLDARHRKLARWCGYPALALGVFFIALWIMFPVERVEAKLVSAFAPHVKVQVESVDKGFFPGNFTFRNMVIETRPKTADDKPATFVIDELSTDFGILSLLGGTASVDIEAVLGAGTVEGEIAASRGGVELEIETEKLAMGGLPGLQTLFAGLPARGGMDATIELTLPKFRWDEARGEISLACADCVVGPGKVTPRTDDAPRNIGMAAFAAEGITMPELQLGKTKIALAIANGRAEVETFEAVSPDGELYAEGYIDLKPSFAESEPHVCFRFKFSDEIKKKNVRVEAMEAGMDRARRPDGYIGMRMTGTMGRPRRIGSPACIPGKPPGVAGGAPTRPTISTTQPQATTSGVPAFPPPAVVPADRTRPIESMMPDEAALEHVNERRPVMPPPGAAGPEPAPQPEEELRPSEEPVDDRGRLEPEPPSDRPALEDMGDQRAPERNDEDVEDTPEREILD